MSVRGDIPGKVHDKVKCPVERVIMQSSSDEVREDAMDSSWLEAWADTRNMNLHSGLCLHLDEELERHIK